VIRQIRIVLVGVCAIAGAVVGPAVVAGAARPAGRTSVAKIPVVLREFSVRPQRDFTSADSVTFVAKNAGTEVHELVLARLADGRPLPVEADGAADEAAIAEADAEGEAEDIPAGRSKRFTASDLTPGAYELFCNIVEQEDGETVSHYAKGMHTVFVVQ